MDTSDKAKSRSLKRNFCEYYNYILLGLVNEMIDLGAGQDLKRTVLVLWHRYVELLNNGANMQDLETCEGKSTKKRKRSQDVPENYATEESKVTDEDPVEIIIIDEESDDDDETLLSNNKSPINQSKNLDIFHRRKMYAIIYLAMLINKDKIQLSDMMRFLKEGHLSYNWLEHFFPEEFNVNVITSRHIRPVTNFFTTKCLREITHRLATFLNVTSYVPTQNLVGLCERYCEELNLPEEIQNYISTLISRTSPQMEYTETSQTVPNYEARAVSFIVFTLKLLFGLDTVTEYRLSKLKNKNCFNFRKWLDYIIYRKLIVCHHHFPTSYGSSNLSDCYLYSKYAKDYYSKLTPEVDADFMQLLRDFGENGSECRFYPTLTPMQDYLKLALERVNVNGGNLILDIVMEDFRHSSVDFLFKPHKYTDLQLKLKHAGANKNIKFVPLHDLRSRYRKEKYDCRRSNSTSNPKEFMDLHPESTLNHAELLESFRTKHKQTFQQRAKSFEKAPNRNAAKSKYYHYNCDEQFWLNTANEAGMTRLEFEDYFESLPYTFQLIVVECSGMINQTVRDVMIEYNVTETSMAYVLRKNPQALSETFNLHKVIERSKKLW